MPAGLPRPHYHFRTTISYGRAGSTLSVYEAPARLYALRGYVDVADLSDPRCRLLWPPAYDYQGSYYGGPYVPYWDRLPYACGVYGYC